jgi:hypothetical protein
MDAHNSSARSSNSNKSSKGSHRPGEYANQGRDSSADTRYFSCSENPHSTSENVSKGSSCKATFTPDSLSTEISDAAFYGNIPRAENWPRNLPSAAEVTQFKNPGPSNVRKVGSSKDYKDYLYNKMGRRVCKEENASNDGSWDWIDDPVKKQRMQDMLKKMQEESDNDSSDE